MAYNYNFNTQAPIQGVQPNPPQFAGPPAIPQQNIQPLFPQPQGNVYNINSTLEVANVPVGAGVSVALCLPENLMYIKTMQNGNPLFYPYKIVPFNANEGSPHEVKEESKQADVIGEITTQLAECNKRITQLEEQLSKKSKDKGGWDV